MPLDQHLRSIVVREALQDPLTVNDTTGIGFIVKSLQANKYRQTS